MSGPALRQLAAHRSIHEAAYGQVKEMTKILRKLYEAGRDKEARHGEDILLEQWRDHIIAHADDEERGLYLEVKESHPHLSEKITQLTRDHDLLRDITARIEAVLDDEEARDERLAMYESLLVVNWHHSRDEEKFLIGELQK